VFSRWWSNAFASTDSFASAQVVSTSASKILGLTAIIAPCATTGEIWPEKRNRAADLELENELRGTGRWVRRLTGYDPETGHAEPGWAVEIGFQEALDLGRRFRQDAIFWISANRVWVAKCASDLKSAEGGPFSDQFEIEEKLR
jgi:hypothetical protein